MIDLLQNLKFKTKNEALVACPTEVLKSTSSALTTSAPILKFFIFNFELYRVINT